jgi:hypothetical protein
MPLSISGDTPNFSAATITAGTITTGTVTTLNAPSGVLATQNGMTGIAKAWVQFSVSGTTPTINASFNVSSITYNGTGDWTATFTTAMPNAFSVGSGFARVSGSAGSITATNDTTFTTTTYRFATANSSNNPTNPLYAGIAVFNT